MSQTRHRLPPSNQFAPGSGGHTAGKRSGDELSASLRKKVMTVNPKKTLDHCRTKANEAIDDFVVKFVRCLDVPMPEKNNHAGGKKPFDHSYMQLAYEASIAARKAALNLASAKIDEITASIDHTDSHSEDLQHARQEHEEAENKVAADEFCKPEIMQILKSSYHHENYCMIYRDFLLAEIGNVRESFFLKVRYNRQDIAEHKKKDFNAAINALKDRDPTTEVGALETLRNNAFKALEDHSDDRQHSADEAYNELKVMKMRSSELEGGKWPGRYVQTKEKLREQREEVGNGITEKIMKLARVNSGEDQKQTANKLLTEYNDREALKQALEDLEPELRYAHELKHGYSGSKRSAKRTQVSQSSTPGAVGIRSECQVKPGS